MPLLGVMVLLSHNVGTPANIFKGRARRKWGRQFESWHSSRLVLSRCASSREGTHGAKQLAIRQADTVRVRREGGQTVRWV
jgi:hypothetical protein